MSLARLVRVLCCKLRGKRDGPFANFEDRFGEMFKTGRAEYNGICAFDSRPLVCARARASLWDDNHTQTDHRWLETGRDVEHCSSFYALYALYAVCALHKTSTAANKRCIYLFCELFLQTSEMA